MKFWRFYRFCTKKLRHKMTWTDIFWCDNFAPSHSAKRHGVRLVKVTQRNDFGRKRPNCKVENLIKLLSSSLSFWTTRLSSLFLVFINGTIIPHVTTQLGCHIWMQLWDCLELSLSKFNQHFFFISMAHGCTKWTVLLRQRY